MQDKKLILIVEDEHVNCEILAMILQGSYDILTAHTGREALALIDEKGDRLSLVLLDLNLPDIEGMEILRRIRKKDLHHRLPVIVMTADRNAEVESLDLGASDFIPKPYPRPEVIKARVRRTIELSEDRIIIGQTEHDSLTGLYSREFFFRYADQFDIRHAELEMDAIALSINHFHMINERYGRIYADEVLKRIADNITGILDEREGIACRKEADNFLIYCIHRSDYTDLLDSISEGAAGEGKDENVVRLRMGVYPNADKSIEIERRFDRAKLAADTVRSTFTKAVAIYDSELHESAMFSEQLLVDFPRAIEENQFKVYYQPKFDIRGELPVLHSAEALARWEHPEFGLLGPGYFIGLFESNGLIKQMDQYIRTEAAKQIMDWYVRYGVKIPVSVNVSRVDLFDPDIVDSVSDLTDEYGLSGRDLMIEVTESAYSQDSDHIVRTVENFRKHGFFIEMDDFGAGYSSLNMLSDLPVDALKLDMQFIRTAFKNGKNTRMLEIVIEIAASLGVPVIAEGVETAEQLFTLKAMGCDIVQGFYFSEPVPAPKFEEFIIEAKDRKSDAPMTPERRMSRKLIRDRMTYEALHDPSTGLYNSSGFDILLYDADRKHSTLVLVDISNYEDISRNEGSDSADRTVRAVAEVLKHSFRASDFVCRLGVHRFAVILTRANINEKDVISEKVQSIQTAYDEFREGSPDAALRFGIAFGNKDDHDRDMMAEAEKALEGGSLC
ncbi:MAG: EAL domain-containing protein [Mogibacterium sp.]|nr:EAL domain-containing protein [Mogibacterium sp.]